jgi:hypothetical protein
MAKVKLEGRDCESGTVRNGIIPLTVVSKGLESKHRFKLT